MSFGYAVAVNTPKLANIILMEVSRTSDRSGPNGPPRVNSYPARAGKLSPWLLIDSSTISLIDVSRFISLYSSYNLLSYAYF